MTISLGSAGDDDDLVSDINTTPLVDVMLVLLIIFLITIPVVTQTIELKLPQESNIPRQTAPENIDLSINQDGDVYWNLTLVPDSASLHQRLMQIAQLTPQPEVQIRGDERTRFEAIGRVLLQCQRAAIHKVSFITQPPAKD